MREKLCSRRRISWSFSTPGCGFTVTLNWPNYRLLMTFLSLLARAGTERIEQDLGFHTGLWFTQKKVIFLLFKILSTLVLGWISSFLSVTWHSSSKMSGKDIWLSVFHKYIWKEKKKKKSCSSPRNLSLFYFQSFISLFHVNVQDRLHTSKT